MAGPCAGHSLRSCLSKVTGPTASRWVGRQNLSLLYLHGRRPAPGHYAPLQVTVTTWLGPTHVQAASWAHTPRRGSLRTHQNTSHRRTHPALPTYSTTGHVRVPDLLVPEPDKPLPTSGGSLQDTGGPPLIPNSAWCCVPARGLTDSSQIPVGLAVVHQDRAAFLGLNRTRQLAPWMWTRRSPPRCRARLLCLQGAPGREGEG